MEISAEVLQELHRFHRQLGDLTSRLARGPKLVKVTKQAVLNHEKALETAKETYKRARMDSDEKQLQLKQREAKIVDLQRKLNEANSNQEFTAFKDQIAATQQANSVLEDEILEKLELLDTLKVEVQQAEEKLVKVRDEAEKTLKRVEEQKDSLEADVQRLRTELAAAEEALPSDFRADYRRIARSRGEEALAAVEGESCGGCSTILSPQVMNELQLKKPVFCRSCGCLLYLPEDRSVGAPQG
jgi:predicted  nucleic acid-binding Zn-ribbon protein